MKSKPPLKCPPFKRWCFLLTLLALPTLCAAAPRQPNIIVVLADDIGQGDISHFNPQSGYSTPQIDGLARNGFAFRHAHSSGAVCAPTRYSLLTGNHAFRGRLPDGTWTHCAPSQILPGQKTIAEILRGAGYRTAFLGKLHMGGQFHKKDGTGPAKLLRDADLSRPMFDGPIDHGFDYSLALLSGVQHSPYAFFENDRLARWNPGTNSFDVFETDAEAREVFKHRVVKGKTEDKVRRTWDDNYYMDNYQSEQVGPILAHQALKFIDRHVAETPDRPFFMSLFTEAAHYPFTPPADLSPADPDDWDKPGNHPVKGKTPTPRGDMVYESDVTTGVIMEHLKKLGIADNTIIIYASDNGAAQYPAEWDDPKYFCFKWGPNGGNRTDRTEKGRTGRIWNPQGVAENGQPLRGEKGAVYEGGHRIPFVISWGKDTGLAETLRGTENSQLIGVHDLFATLCDLAGTRVPEGQARDSVSFASLLKTGKSEPGAARTHLIAEAARVPFPYEQKMAKEIAQQKNLTAKTDANGVVVALEGEGAPENKDVTWEIESARQAQTLIHEDGGKRWKLIVISKKEKPGQDIEPWELYELVSDPDESDNLIAKPEHAARVRDMLETLRRTLDSGAS